MGPKNFQSSISSFHVLIICLSLFSSAAEYYDIKKADPYGNFCWKIKAIPAAFLTWVRSDNNANHRSIEKCSWKKIVLGELLPFPMCFLNIHTPFCLCTDTRDTGLWGQENPMRKSRWNLLGFPLKKKCINDPPPPPRKKAETFQLKYAESNPNKIATPMPKF